MKEKIKNFLYEKLNDDRYCKDCYFIGEPLCKDCYDEDFWTPSENFCGELADEIQEIYEEKCDRIANEVIDEIIEEEK